jgi:excinuclease UvrABC helicase subunit UvrB
MIGRAARNQAGKVILYADRITDIIEAANERDGKKKETPDNI